MCRKQLWTDFNVFSTSVNFILFSCHRKDVEPGPTKAAKPKSSLTVLNYLMSDQLQWVNK